MTTRMISRMTACSHSHLFHPFCPRQTLSHRVSNVVLYAFGAAVACWALYQMSRRPLQPSDTALIASPPGSTALNLTGKPASFASKIAAVSPQKGAEATHKPNEIADHFCRIVETARKQPGKPVAYDWTQKDAPVSDSTPRLTVTFMQLPIEGETEKQEVTLIANSALIGQYIQWTSQVESNMRKGLYPEGMELKTLLGVLNARPRVFLD